MPPDEFRRPSRVAVTVRPAGSALLRIGCNQPLPPLIEERDGELLGFEPALARRLCATVGWTPRWCYHPFPDLPDALQAASIDCIMWNLVKTPERAARFRLSRPYGGTDMALMVRDQGPVRSLDDLSGRSVGAVRGTTNLAMARTLPGLADVRVYDPGLKVLGMLVEDLLDGVIDAALDDAVPFRAIVRRNSALRIAATLPTANRYVVAFRFDDANRRDAIDGALAALIETGELERLWLEHVDEPIPPDVLEGR